MIINNTHVQGIFLYSKDIEFEKGDFVVSGDCIYICTAENPTNTTNNTVSGIEPSTDLKNFNTYLGNKTVSVEEYYEYKNTGLGEDKYVSSHVLCKILENLMFGVGDNGIITEHVLVDSENNVSYSTNIEEAIKEVTESLSPLDKVLRAESLNNGLVRISRSLVPELISELPNDLPNSYSSADKNSVILKQYTYIDNSESTSPYFRVQELIDHINGLVFYRYSKSIPGSDGKVNWSIGNISTWKRSSINGNFLDEVNKVYTWCIQEKANIESLKSELIGNFKFKNITITKGSNSISLNATGNLPTSTSKFSDTSTIITVIVQKSMPGSIGLFKNSSITFDISDSYGQLPITNYYISDDLSLTITADSESEVTLELNSGVFVNIYYRLEYK